jgi:TetR/AcrR family transcriptional regulator
LARINQSINKMPTRPTASRRIKTVSRSPKAPTRRGARRRVGRPADADSNSRDALLDAAAQLMHERNTIDISLSELAAHSQLNSALVKYYFGNKEGLLLALLKRDAAKALADLELLIASDVPAKTKIKRHIAAVIDTFHRSPYLNRLLHAMLDDRASDTDSAKQITTFFVRPFVKLQRQLLDQGVKSGGLRKIDPMFFYVSVLGACDLLFNARFTLRAVFGVPTISATLRDRYIEHVTDLVLHGIVARSH